MTWRFFKLLNKLYCKKSHHWAHFFKVTSAAEICHEYIQYKSYNLKKINYFCLTQKRLCLNSLKTLACIQKRWLNTILVYFFAWNKKIECSSWSFFCMHFKKKIQAVKPFTPTWDFYARQYLHETFNPTSLLPGWTKNKHNNNILTLILQMLWKSQDIKIYVWRLRTLSELWNSQNYMLN